MFLQRRTSDYFELCRPLLQMSSSDKTLISSFREIGTMAERIRVPRTIVDRANILFKQVHEGKSLKGRSNDAISSACLYIACRQENVPRTFKVSNLLRCFFFKFVRISLYLIKIRFRKFAPFQKSVRKKLGVVSSSF